MTTKPSSSIPFAIAELVKIASMGGGRGISLTTQPRGTLGAKGKPFEIFAKNMFAGSLGALPNHVDAAWSKTFSWLGSDNAPPDFMIWGGDAVEVKVHGSTTQIQLNSSPPKRSLKATDTRIEEGCRECEIWVEKDFVYFVGKANAEYVEALWLIDGKCIAAESSVYDVLFDQLKTKCEELGGKPGNEISRFNKIDPLEATSLRVRGMWLLDHPAKVFDNLFVKPQNDCFVLNALVSQTKWNEYSSELIGDLEALADKGLDITHVDLPDSGGAEAPLKAVHISWQISVV
ncbi:MAG: NgoPII family restriction endonuclease [Acidimicrobiaceae bacterium]